MKIDNMKFNISQIFRAKLQPCETKAKRKRPFRYALLIVAIATGNLCASGVDRATFKVSLDSATMTMGYTTNLHIEITDPAGNGGFIDASNIIPETKNSYAPEIVGNDTIKSFIPATPRQLVPGVEIVGDDNLSQLPQTIDDNGRAYIDAIIKIQAFDSGVYTLPPLAYIHGSDTVWSNPLTLKVNPVVIDPESNLDPAEQVVDIESKWYDWIPDFLTDNWDIILLVIVVIAAGILVYLMMTKRVTVTILPKKKPEPPYNIAIRKLQALKEEQLWEQGHDKEFYTRLIDILREYLDRRFNINAMEMTSTQIRRALKSNAELASSRELINEVLEVADYVKFAKAKPLREDNIHSFNAAARFIEDTKPQEPTENAQEDKADDESSQKSEMPDTTIKE